MDKYEQQRQGSAKGAKAELFAYLAEKCPQIARITAFYNGYADEGGVEEVHYFGAGGGDEPLDFDDETLYGLVDNLFQYVTPDGFVVNKGGDGEIHAYAATQKVVVEHN
jgi:hypothetical protein